MSPTPWRAEGWENVIVNDAEGNTLALMPGGHSGLAIVKANAALIAAAPDLLEALEELEITATNRENTMGDLCNLFECKAKLASAIRKARAVIEKAKP